MTELRFLYNDKECAYVSEKLEMTCNIALFISLKTNGCIVVRKNNKGEEESPVAYVSKNALEESVKITMDEDVMKRDVFEIQVFTSEEPKYIRYANI